MFPSRVAGADAQHYGRLCLSISLVHPPTSELEVEMSKLKCRPHNAENVPSKLDQVNACVGNVLPASS